MSIGKTAKELAGLANMPVISSQRSRVKMTSHAIIDGNTLQAVMLCAWIVKKQENQKFISTNPDDSLCNNLRALVPDDPYECYESCYADAVKRFVHRAKIRLAGKSYLLEE